ncbi:MAG: helix-turn-helix transcriptional regulator [Kiritimatiellae bacterium]|nr:helix-turn-helix transcriptional regulator [Kiritimatiellia bacterium]
MKEIKLEYFAEKDSRTLNPESFGLHGVVQLGVSRFRQMRVPTGEHIHRGMLEIGFCLRSPLALKVAGGELPVMPGSFFINQPNVPHCLNSRPNGLYIYYFLVRRPTASRPFLDLPVPESAAVWKFLRRLPSVLPAGVRASRVRELFTRLFQLCDMPCAPLTSVQMRQMFLDVIMLLHELSERPADIGCSERVAKVVELVRTHPERPFRIDVLAREAALSPTHFINQFRKATGFPPIRFQIECRIKKAKEMLRTPDRTASDVALQLGFNSLQHFSDTFSRLVGISPARWRAGT